ncbi:MAG: VOC family protein [Chloroflexi bacterium]|nr:VOC family protein [Chloroflexota bacterium]
MTASRLPIDHLQYVTADVAATSEALAERLGVRPVGGGSHIGLGTRNTLLALGPDVYLEVIGPDPHQDVQHPPARFPAEPVLRGWAVRTEAIEATVEASRERGYDPGEVSAMSRAQPGGGLLEWRLTPPGRRGLPTDGRAGLIPFVIDWGESEHPALSAPAGCRLRELRGEHPEPEAVRALLAALGADLDVTLAAEAALIATIEAPNGRIEQLR